jgi:hypothetical protein
MCGGGVPVVSTKKTCRSLTLSVFSPSSRYSLLQDLLAYPDDDAFVLSQVSALKKMSRLPILFTVTMG